MIELREIEGEPEKAPSDIRWIAGFSLQVFSNLTVIDREKLLQK